MGCVVKQVFIAVLIFEFVIGVCELTIIVVRNNNDVKKNFIFWVFFKNISFLVFIVKNIVATKKDYFFNND